MFSKKKIVVMLSSVALASGVFMGVTGVANSESASAACNVDKRHYKSFNSGCTLIRHFVKTSRNGTFYGNKASSGNWSDVGFCPAYETSHGVNIWP